MEMTLLYLQKHTQHQGKKMTTTLIKMKKSDYCNVGKNHLQQSIFIFLLHTLIQNLHKQTDKKEKDRESEKKRQTDRQTDRETKRKNSTIL